jgi:hAT family C-terminal dimerisation region
MLLRNSDLLKCLGKAQQVLQFDRCQSFYLRCGDPINPSHRKACFYDQWTSPYLVQWKEVMITRVRDILEEEYRTSPCEPEEPKQFNFLDRHFRKPQLQVASDQFRPYMNGAPVEIANESDEDLLAWRTRPSNPFKQLPQQALDLLSIPAMSAEVERVFSSAKRLTPPDRNRLNDEIMEVMQLLKYWWKNGVATTTPQVA